MVKSQSPRQPDTMNLSFENELTFVPKLNSLSMKLAGGTNRTSILKRSPKQKNDQLDSSYTFKPVVGEHSSKIVAKLKTGFLERQKLHVKRQNEKVYRIVSIISARTLIYRYFSFRLRRLFDLLNLYRFRGA